MSEKNISGYTRAKLVESLAEAHAKIDELKKVRDNCRREYDKLRDEIEDQEKVILALRAPIEEKLAEHAKERERLQEQLRALVDLVGAKERHLRSVRAWFVNTIDVLLNTQRETTRNLIMSAAGETLIPNEQAKGK